MAFAKIEAAKADFAICGGDLLYDVLGVGQPRADTLFDLYQRTEDSLKIPLCHTIGNHDLFGVLTKSGVEPSDPGYGKKMYEDRIGAQTYYSFDHKGYHFIVLDSIWPTPDRFWEGRIDEAQLRWLRDDLSRHRAARSSCRHYTCALDHRISCIRAEARRRRRATTPYPSRIRLT